MHSPALLVLALAFTASGEAIAADAPASPVGAAFGNTVVSTYPDGRTALLWLKSDGSYTAKGRRRTDSSGRWSMKDQQVCLKQARPVPVPLAFCTVIPENAVGATWSAKAVTGEIVKVAIVRGRVS